MKDDYRELLGEGVLYTNGGTVLEAFVAGIDYEKGITVVEKDNPENELICLNKDEKYAHSYDDLFNYYTIGLGLGVCSSEVYREIFPPSSFPFRRSFSSCAFK